jgi:hypothetical protein
VTLLERRLILVCAAAAAVGAAFCDAAPTGARPVDALLSAGFAAVVTLATSRARRWTWFVLAGLAAVAAGDAVTVGLAAVALATSIFGALIPRRRVLGAVVGALAIQVLLRLPDLGFHGSTALYVATAVAPVLLSGYLLLPRARRRVVHRALLGAGVVGAIALGVFGLSVALAWSAMQDGVRQARQGLEAASDGDAKAAAALFESATSSLESSHRLFGAWWARPARGIPVLAQQAEALEVATGQAAQIAGAAGDVAVSADLERIRYTSGRIDVARLAATRQPLERASAVMTLAADRLHAVSSPWLIGPVSDALAGLTEDVDATLDDIELAAEAAAVAPGMLGADGARHYLVLFTQPAEARGLGGFVGSWAELRAVDGDLDLTDSGPIRELLAAPGSERRSLSGPPEYLARYGRFRPWQYLQDVTFSPDLPTVAAVMAELYPQSGGRPVDGVIVADPYGLAALLKLTGPIRVEGAPQRLTADNVAQFLVKDQYLQFGETAQRREFLEDVGRETFDQLVNGSLPGPRRLASALGPAVEERRLMMYAFDPAQERFLSHLGVAGEAPRPEGADGLMLVTQNWGQNKIDVFLRRDVDYQVTYDPATGEVEGTVTVTLHNDAPSSGLPDAIIGSNDLGLPLGTNSLYLSVYTPHHLQEARLDGERIGVEFQRELGWAVYSRFVKIPPGGSVRIELDVKGSIDPGARYRLLVGAQPLVNPDTVAATVRPARGWVIEAARGFGITDVGTSAQARIEPRTTTALEADLVRLP